MALMFTDYYALNNIGYDRSELSNVYLFEMHYGELDNESTLDWFDHSTPKLSIAILSQGVIIIDNAHVRLFWQNIINCLSFKLPLSNYKDFYRIERQLKNVETFKRVITETNPADEYQVYQLKFKNEPTNS